MTHTASTVQPLIKSRHNDLVQLVSIQDVEHH